MASAKVLVIEDNQRIGDKLVDFLAAAGFAATLATDGRSALDLFAADRPDLVVADHLVPGAGADGIVARLRALDDEVPLLVMGTGSSPPDVGSGARGFLLKPFRARELLGAIERALSARTPEPAPAGPDRAGLIDEVGLARLLLRLVREGASGVLRMEKDGVNRAVYLLNGLPVFAESNLLSETFGRYLLHREVIDEAQYRKVQAHMVEHGVRQGEALVALGILDNHEVYALLRGQVRERVIRCFEWPGAAYTFHPDDGFVEDKLLFPMNPVSLLVEATVRRHTPQALKAWLDQVGDQRVHMTPLCDELGDYVDRLQREPPLRALLAEAPPAAEVPRALRLVEPRAAAILCTLHDIGAIALDGLSAEDTREEPTALPAEPSVAMELCDPRLAEAAPADDPAARRVFERYLATRGGDHFAVLGLAADATADAIEVAWLSICREFHPDAFADHPDAEVRARAKEVFLRAGQAFGVLGDAERREAYRATLGLRPSATAPRFDAEAEFARGERLLGEGEAAGARDAFARALGANPGEPLFEVYLGWATFAAATDEAGRREGERVLLRGLRRDPASAVGYRLLARLYTRTGRAAEAADLALRATQLEAHTGPLTGTGSAR